MKILVLVLCICLLRDCESHKKMVEKNNEYVVQTIPQQVFESETTPCYGTYPAYKVVVFENDGLNT